jgi:hypothetical protein
MASSLAKDLHRLNIIAMASDYIANQAYPVGFRIVFMLEALPGVNNL